MLRAAKYVTSLTCSVRFRYSREFIITKAGAKYTNELPWTSGSRVPKYECSIVVMPDTNSIVEMTVAISFCHHYKTKRSEYTDLTPLISNCTRNENYDL